MPADTVYYPRDTMTADQKAHFMSVTKQAVAMNMEAIDPITGHFAPYGTDPDRFIDLVMLPYDPDDASVTTPFLATIVSYAWPSRMVNLEDRITAITVAVRHHAIPMGIVAEDKEAISFTFLDKQLGAWAVA